MMVVGKRNHLIHSISSSHASAFVSPRWALCANFVHRYLVIYIAVAASSSWLRYNGATAKKAPGIPAKYQMKSHCDSVVSAVAQSRGNSVSGAGSIWKNARCRSDRNLLLIEERLHGDEGGMLSVHFCTSMPIIYL